MKSKRQRAIDVLSSLKSGSGVMLAEDMAAGDDEHSKELGSLPARGVSTWTPPNAVTIEQDGKVLTGGEWIYPDDFADSDVQQGLLPGMKGMTMTTLPTLNSNDEGIVMDDETRERITGAADAAVERIEREGLPEAIAAPGGGRPALLGSPEREQCR